MITKNKNVVVRKTTWNEIKIGKNAKNANFNS